MPDKILIAEPIYEGLPPEIYFNRILFWQQVWGNDVPQGCYDARADVLGPRKAIRRGRNEAIDVTVEGNATHLFFLDDDIKVPSQILDVLRRLDKPIVGGLMHKPDDTPLVFRDCTMEDYWKAGKLISDYEFQRDPGELPWIDHPKEGVFECAAVGAGCMLIKVEVLRALRPLRRWLFNYDETERSMDVRFCRMARQAGFSVWCWPDVPCVQLNHC